MAQIVSTKCDVCGETKKQVNHWWKVWINGSRIFMFCAADNHTASPPVETALDVCGSNCASKMFQRFLTGGTLDQYTETTTELVSQG